MFTMRSIGRISSLLILAFILNLALCSSSGVSAFDLKRSLSFADGLGSLLKQESNQNQVYASDDSLMAAQGNSNKISKAIRFLHNKAGDVVYKRNKSMRDQQMKDVDKLEHPYEPDHLAQPDTRTDEQVISDACKDHNTRTCGYAVKTALKQGPVQKSRLALALRRKPDYVDSSKLLYHKLFEGAIGKMEEKGIDSKLDTGLGLMINRTPYGLMANKALNLAANKL